MNESAGAGIKAIDRGTVHRICSGQVVLSLAVALKELVENSLDAGATSIIVKLKNYGSEIVEVSDNGHGVHPSNFQGLSLKHHTSKISDFSDLVSVSTFGFRGEALSSLCALSEVTVKTRHSTCATGSTLVFDSCGTLVKSDLVARDVGTTVILSNLFASLPVRHKEFTRNLKREFDRAVQLLSAYCLVSTGVKITCSNQTGSASRTVLTTQGCASVKENISCVFGTKQLKELIPLKTAIPPDEVLDELKADPSDLSKFEFDCLISSCRHGSGRSVSDRQFYYVNSRPCEPTKVMKTVNEVYRQYNGAQYPFVYLNIKVALHSVDVNVTPDKRQVFLNEEKLLLTYLKYSLIETYKSIPSTYKLSAVSVPKAVFDTPALSRFSQWRHKNDSGKRDAEDSLENPSKQFKLDNSQKSLESFNFRRCHNDVKISGNNYEKTSSNDVHWELASLKTSQTSLLECPDTSSLSQTSLLECPETSSLSQTSLLECPETSSLSQTSQPECLGTSSLSQTSQPECLGTSSPSQTSKPESSGTSSPSQTSLLECPETSSLSQTSQPESSGNSSLSQTSQSESSGISSLSQTSQPECHRTDSFSQTLHPNVCSNRDSLLPTLEYDTFTSKGPHPQTFLSLSLSQLQNDIEKRIKRSSTTAMSLRFRAPIDPSKNSDAESELSRSITKEAFLRMEVIGQFNLGFIVAKLDSDLFIIDQHASDEKFNFETLQKNTRITSQKLVTPLPLELTAGNEAVLIDNMEVFQRNGFEFTIDENEETTRRVRLTAVPMSRNWVFGKEDVDELIFMLQDSPHANCRPSRVRSMFASRACRMSTMIGTALSKNEMTRLVRQMSTMDQPWVSLRDTLQHLLIHALLQNCPHGRPTMRHLVNLGVADFNCV